MGFFVFFFAKETKGRTLEDMDVLFGAVDEADRRAAVERTLNKEATKHVEQADEEDAIPATSVAVSPDEQDKH